MQRQHAVPRVIGSFVSRGRLGHVNPGAVHEDVESTESTDDFVSGAVRLTDFGLGTAPAASWQQSVLMSMETKQGVELAGTTRYIRTIELATATGQRALRPGRPREASMRLSIFSSPRYRVVGTSSSS